jgi:KaiC/GvpD/RAD55 family RecA-like ATPase
VEKMFSDFSQAQTRAQNLKEIFLLVTKRTPEEKKIFSKILRNWVKEDIRPILEKIRIPTLILHGERDPIPVNHIKAMKKKIPNSKLYVFKGARFINVLEPEKFNKILDEFIMNGFERIEFSNVQSDVTVSPKKVKVGENIVLRIEINNFGTKSIKLEGIRNVVPKGFLIVRNLEDHIIDNDYLELGGKSLSSLETEEIKLVLQSNKNGIINFQPQLVYINEQGKSTFFMSDAVTVEVQKSLFIQRVPTGYVKLDSLLLGGIPSEYSVVLSGPPCDERELIVQNFLKTGIKEGVTFYIATEIAGLEGLLENPNFYLFLCNPKPKTKVPDRSNVFRLQSKADITNLGIALTKAYRSIDKSIANKRICIDILSDVLVKHGTDTTREWISGLITDLGAKGFTMLAVMNPTMHLPNEANAVLDLFDGEISITQSDDPLDCKKSILVKKLRNQDYIKNPICLT